MMTITGKRGLRHPVRLIRESASRRRRLDPHIAYFTQIGTLRIMEVRITATALARRLGDVLGRIRYRGDTFVVERNGVPVARLLPVAESGAATVADALAAWRAVGEADPKFAEDLERVGALDRPTADPWAS